MTTRTLNQVRVKGIEALVDTLGPVDAVRFLSQFETGAGDYSAERNRLLGNPSLDDVMKKVKRLQKAG